MAIQTPPPVRTTDFEVFIECELLDEDDFEEIEALDRVVERADDEGSFTVATVSNGEMTVTGNQATLVLKCDAARQDFRTYLYDRFASEFPDIEAWASFSRAMANPHA